MQTMYAIAFFAALRVGEITCQTNQSQQNLIFLNQVSFIRSREDSVNVVKLTLRNYKHSDPANPVDIFIYRAKPVCPIMTGFDRFRIGYAN